MIAAATPTVFRQNRFQTRKVGPATLPERNCGTETSESVIILFEANARVDDRVENVGNEVPEQDERRDNEV